MGFYIAKSADNHGLRDAQGLKTENYEKRKEESNVKTAFHPLSLCFSKIMFSIVPPCSPCQIAMFFGGSEMSPETLGRPPRSERCTVAPRQAQKREKSTAANLRPKGKGRNGRKGRKLAWQGAQHEKYMTDAAAFAAICCR